MHTAHLRIFCVYDKISGFIPMFFTASSASEACRKAISSLPALRFDDYQLYSCGSYDLFAPPVDSKKPFKPLVLGRDVKVQFLSTGSWIPVSWSDWRAPESKADLLAPLGLTTSEMETICKDKISDLNLDSSARMSAANN